MTGVASDDTLNVRTGPGMSNRVILLAPNGAVFHNLGCRGEGNGRWCHVETPDGTISGWVAGRLLQDSGAPTQGNGSGQSEVPELYARQSGEMEVRFASGCTAHTTRRASVNVGARSGHGAEQKSSGLGVIGALANALRT
ncbi:SH3 domain-containing protein [Meridianimarinicoccus roseus]|uniref:SH3 domain-containing protein n=1 Tax=Meridianimarinicoccus roseus TaxID=2072018 RepID=UPI001EE68260|nr:SH3 domain-containing protein [Meridianimarinicoccus roseus]